MPAFADPDTYRDILDALQIGVSVLDLKRNIIFWSDGAEQIAGYARIDVLGHSCADNILQHCNQSSCELCNRKCPISAVMHDGSLVGAVTFLHHKKGHRMLVRTCTVPLRDKHGSLIGIIQTFESEFSAHDKDLTSHGMNEHGWIDELTALPNQALMQFRLRECLGSFVELNIPFGVLCFEAIDYPQFRARYGQPAAASILRVLAQTLRNSVWPADFVGRWGEGQFIVILAGCGDGELQSISDRLLRMLLSATIEWWGEHLAIGVSTVRTSAQSGDGLESLLKRMHLTPCADQPSALNQLTGAAAAAGKEQS